MWPIIWAPCGPSKLAHKINCNREVWSGYWVMRLLSLEVYTETTQKHAFIGYSCLDPAYGGWPFGMGSDGLAHYCHSFQNQLLSGPWIHWLTLSLAEGSVGLSRKNSVEDPKPFILSEVVDLTGRPVDGQWQAYPFSHILPWLLSREQKETRRKQSICKIPWWWGMR